jgi:hypothetical protein
MKPFLLTMVTGLLFACSTEREIQADLVSANLVKIDTLTRYPNIRQKMLTWQATDNVLYITYEPMYTNVSVGARREVMIRK